MKTFSAQIGSAFQEVMEKFNASPAIRFLQSQDFRAEHYASALREFYHYTKENPQQQTLASTYFRGTDRKLIKLFVSHARAEIGHDHMALDDLKALGADLSLVPTENPLPATTALTAFGYFQIERLNAIGYLGYIYFLEYMPTQHGAIYAEALLKAGVPKESLGFLQEHIAVDMSHNKMMEQYLAHLLHSQADADSVIYAMRVTAELYANMLWSAIQRVGSPVSYGKAWHEISRTRTDTFDLPAMVDGDSGA